MILFDDFCHLIFQNGGPEAGIKQRHFYSKFMVYLSQLGKVGYLRGSSHIGIGGESIILGDGSGDYIGTKVKRIFLQPL